MIGKIFAKHNLKTVFSNSDLILNNNTKNVVSANSVNSLKDKLDHLLRKNNSVGT